MSEWILTQNRDCSECQRWAMGFDPTERQQITNIALGLGQSPTTLGELIMRCRPITFTLPFVFWRDFDWRKAWLLTVVLALVAAVTG